MKRTRFGVTSEKISGLMGLDVRKIVRDILLSEDEVWEDNEIILSSWMVGLSDDDTELLRLVYLDCKSGREVDRLCSRRGGWTFYRLQKILSPIKQVIYGKQKSDFYNIIGAETEVNIECFLVDILKPEAVRKIRATFAESGLSDSARSEVILDWLEHASLSHEFEMLKTCIGLYPGEDFLGLQKQIPPNTSLRMLGKIQNGTPYKTAVRRLQKADAARSLIMMTLEKELNNE